MDHLCTDSDQIFYNQRFQYLKIITNYLRKKITARKFVTEFSILYQEEADKRKNIKSHKMSQIRINPNSEGFSNVICNIFSACEHHEFKWNDLEQNHEMIDETIFEASIQLSFLELKYYIDLEFSESNDQKILSWTMLFFISVIISFYIILKPEILNYLV